MTTRTASCSCGRLTATVTGDPVRISVCHCLACQRRTGSVFAAQARFPRENVQPSGTGYEFTQCPGTSNTSTKTRKLMEPDHPGMHTTDTVDFEYIVSGEVSRSWLERAAYDDNAPEEAA